MKALFSFSLLASLFIAPAHAAKFTNQFTEFELPPGWSCQLEDAEWVCQSVDDAKKKEAIIVLAAKLKGDQDSIDQYLTYLKSVKSFTSVGGKPMKSEPKYAKTVNINGQPWVDSLHLESEIPGFYTRYLATVKDDIGVLITYSIAKNKYQDYIKDFEGMVNTLKVFRKEGGLNVAPANANLMQIPQSVTESTVFPGVNVAGAPDSPARPQGGQGAGGMDLTTILMIVAGVAVALIILKKRKG